MYVRPITPLLFFGKSMHRTKRNLKRPPYMHDVKATNIAREDIEFEKFKAINNSHKKAHIRSIWYYSVFFPIVEILSAISIIVLGLTSLGQIITFFNFLFIISLIMKFSSL